MRVSKACERCRQRKIKCDGHSPCSSCQKHAQTLCIFRIHNRHRRSKRSPLPASSVTNATDQSQHPERQFPTVGVEQSSTLPYIPIVCGPSSNEYFQRHILKRLNGAVNTCLSLDASNIKAFSTDNNDHMDHMAQSISHSRDPDSLCWPELEPAKARVLLRNYERTIHHLFPLLPVSDLRDLVEKMFCEGIDTGIPTPSKPVILATLAVGATHYAHFHAIMSNPVLSYHSLGVAIRKALAFGLHYDSSESTQTPSVTIWSLYFYETWSSFRLGLPAMLRAENITTPLPEHEPFLCCLVRLSHIINHSSASMYSYYSGPPTSRWTTVCVLAEELSGFASSVREQMQIVIGDLVSSLQPLVQTVMLSNLYFHTFITAFRPFLLDQVRDEEQLIETSHSYSGLRSRALSGTTTYSSQALHQAAETARAWLMFIVEAIDCCPLIRGLRYMHYYFESASYILIYESSEYPPLAQKNYPVLQAGMNALSLIPPEPQLLCTRSTVGSMVSALEQSVIAPLDVLDSASASVDDLAGNCHDI
ncbi:hypothetical protein FE257_006726 [Aspergillus nanangensis]|uniref:Zn(2)-C6 fungal-type domain-containing protein n=1 Tax=Aspergillus nanangensis TaxID=2582783 RepID=A0AAD4CP29_ASPNN|nr:hypothetical protein FE257_006726 [Aspergillus nanangensis]